MLDFFVPVRVGRFRNFLVDLRPLPPPEPPIPFRERVRCCAPPRALCRLVPPCFLDLDLAMIMFRKRSRIALQADALFSILASGYPKSSI